MAGAAAFIGLVLVAYQLITSQGTREGRFIIPIFVFVVGSLSLQSSNIRVLRMEIEELKLKIKSETNQQ